MTKSLPINEIITIALILFSVAAALVGWVLPGGKYVDRSCIQQVQFESEYQLSDADALKLCGG